MTIHLHIGLHKTGTSTIQALLRLNEEKLAGQGYAIPKAGWVQGGHHNPAYDLLSKPKYDPEAGDIAAVIAEADRSANAIVTSEEFEFLELAQVRTLREAIGDRPARVHVYLRRQDALIASTFAQQVKMGAKLGPFEDYAEDSLYNPRFDLSQLLERWTSQFGEENMSVGVVCAETAGDLLFGDFLRRIGASAEGMAASKHLNKSPTWAEIELMRRVVARIKRQGRKLDLEQTAAVRAACYAEVRGRDDLQSGQITMSQAAYERVKARHERGNARVAARFVASLAQREALAFGPFEDAGGRLPGHRLLADAAEALTARFLDGDTIVTPARRARPNGARARRQKAAADQ